MVKAAQQEAEEKNVGGRPTLCTLALAEEIGAFVVKGASIVAACGAAGISSARLSEWKKRTDEPYKGFASTLGRYLAEAIAKAEMNVYGGGDGWRASVRWLQAMRPKRWRSSIGRELPPPPTKPPVVLVNVDLASMLTDRMARLSELPPAPGLRALPSFGSDPHAPLPALTGGGGGGNGDD